MIDRDYMEIKVLRSDLIDALMNRFTDFTGIDTYDDVYSAFDNYYTSLVEDGALDGAEINIMSIVDNDWVNNIITISKDDDLSEYAGYFDSVDEEEISNMSFDSFKELIRDEGLHAAESDNGEVVLMYA